MYKSTRNVMERNFTQWGTVGWIWEKGILAQLDELPKNSDVIGTKLP